MFFKRLIPVQTGQWELEEVKFPGVHKHLKIALFPGSQVTESSLSTQPGYEADGKLGRAWQRGYLKLDSLPHIQFKRLYTIV